MSEIRVDNITDEAGTGRPAFTNGVQTSNINGGQVGGRRNLIINGAMRVVQRATSATGITSFGYYTADRARLSIAGTNNNEVVDQEVLFDQTVDSNTVNVLKTTITTTSSTGKLGYDQRLEVGDVKHLIGKKVTFSAYVRADSPIDLVSFSAIDNSTGNFSSIDLLSGSPITISNSWQRIVGTATFGDISSSDYLDLLIRFDASVGTSFYITMVQFEEGDTATDFEHRSYGEELQLCKRYFQHSWSGLTVEDGRASTTSEGTINCNADQVTLNDKRYAIFSQAFPVEMRDTPSLAIYDRNGNAGQITQYNTGATTETVDSVVSEGAKGLGQRINTTSGTSIDRLAQFHYTADAEL
jgi:hypothetical protein